MHSENEKPSIWNVLDGAWKLLPTILILFGALLILLQFTSNFMELNSMCDQIVTEASYGALDDESALRMGMMFDRTEHCYFRAVDTVTEEVLYESTESPTIMTNQRCVRIGDTSYYYIMDCSHIYAIGVSIIVIAVAVVLIVITHINNVIHFNMKAHKAFVDIEDDMLPGEVASFREGLMNKGDIRKLFNFKIVFWMPVIVFLGCFILTGEYISDVGLMVTDSISGVVQHHGIIQETMILDHFNGLDTVSIDTMPADPNTVPPIVAGGGFHLHNKTAYNYKTLLTGNVCRIQYDLDGYYNPILALGVLMVLYFVHLFLKIKQNDQIDLL